MSVVSNTTVLSNFAAVGQLSRLQQLFGKIAISVEVYQEIREGLAEGYSFYSSVENALNPAVSEGWIQLVSLASKEEIARFLQMPARLHRGEASCLAIARERDWLFLSDDLAARRVARSIEVRMSGSLGVLVSGVERGLWRLHEANGWLGRMVAQGFYSPMIDLSPLLA